MSEKHQKDQKPYVTITGGQNHVILILGSSTNKHSETAAPSPSAKEEPGSSAVKKPKPLPSPRPRGTPGTVFDSLRSASSAPVSGPITITHQGGAMNLMIKRKRSRCEGDDRSRGKGQGGTPGPEKHSSSEADTGDFKTGFSEEADDLLRGSEEDGVLCEPCA